MVRAAPVGPAHCGQVRCGQAGNQQRTLRLPTPTGNMPHPPLKTDAGTRTPHDSDTEQARRLTTAALTVGCPRVEAQAAEMFTQSAAGDPLLSPAVTLAYVGAYAGRCLRRRPRVVGAALGRGRAESS